MFGRIILYLDNRYNGDHQTARDTISILARQTEYQVIGGGGYVLALIAELRGEDDPAWPKHLCKNVKADFEKS